MKAVILAGGYGTRLSEETGSIPKPMIEIGGKPILWHIMKLYSHYGVNDFVICLGYKSYAIKEFFSNYFLHTSDVTFDLKNNKLKIHRNSSEPWTVTLIDTGLETMIGGRIKKIIPYVKNEKFFCLTYGDGLSDVNIKSLISFHKKNKKLATVTGVQPPGRFGSLKVKGDKVAGFIEKPLGDGGWINGGYFVLSPKINDYIKGDNTIWEKDPMENLAADGELMVFKHKGFWQPMDTLRDKVSLQKIWDQNKAEWRVW